MKTETLHVSGMTCTGCETRIKNALQDQVGVHKVKVSFRAGSVTVAYDPSLIQKSALEKQIRSAGYNVRQPDQPESRLQSARQLVQILLGLMFLYFAARHTGLLNLFNLFPQAQAGMSYGALFLTGLFTSLHCTAMCGGIQLSQCLDTSQASRRETSRSALRPSLLYNLGRVVSYTLIGGIVGALGSVLTVSSAAKGFIQLAAGLFMVLMGVNLLGLFPGLRRFMPHLPSLLPEQTQASAQSAGPLYVGLLNGLMPCGPLQAMQLYALSTGSAASGALSMLLFSLGTVPLMLGLGTLSSLLSRKYTRKLTAAGAVLVVLLGVSMLGNGLALSGVSLGRLPEGGGLAAASDGYQLAETQLTGGRYAPITVEANIPVRWTINAPQGSLNGCNRSIIIPQYGIRTDLNIGENVIEFTPTETGTYLYTCWMGMIRSTITVIGEGEDSAGEPQNNQLAPQRRQIVVN